MDYGAVGDGVTDDLAAINAAISAAAQNSAVIFPPNKTFLVSGSISTTKRVVLRGGGHTTVIKSRSPSGGDNATIRFDGSGGSTDLFYADAAKGASNIVLNSASGYAVGSWLQIIKSNKLGLVEGNLENTSGKVMSQWVRVHAIANVTNITTDRPLYWPYATLQGAYASKTSLLTNCGVENLKIDAYSNALFGIRFVLCGNSWVSGVMITNTGAHGVQLYSSARCTVRSNWLMAPIKDFDSRYAVSATQFSTDCLIEDNIIDGWSAGGMASVGSSGNVFGYNYVHRGFQLTPITTSTRFSFFCHGTFSTYNLFIGNKGGRGTIDDYWGSNHKNTLARNWFTASQLNETNGWTTGTLIAAENDRTNRWNNWVGNILNYPGQSGLSPWTIGGSSWIPDDEAETVAVTLRHGNGNFITNTVEWDAAIADQSIPACYYLAAKPDWFGRFPFPIGGPDVNITTSLTNVAYNPAEARFRGQSYHAVPFRRSGLVRFRP